MLLRSPRRSGNDTTPYFSHDSLYEQMLILPVSRDPLPSIPGQGAYFLQTADHEPGQPTI
jgi:hypothetical protein